MKCGTIIQLGMYPQEDAFPSPIDWFVIGISSDKALLLSKYILDVRPFAEHWETSEIRRWLNAGFYNSAFSEAEKGRICESVLLNDTAVVFGYEYDEDRRWHFPSFSVRTNSYPTRDRIFLLDVRDIKRNFNPGDELENTYEYIDDNILLTCSTKFASPKECRIWWLRTETRKVNYLGWDLTDYSKCMHVGITEGCGCSYHHPMYEYHDLSLGVRPALWVKM